MGPSKQLKQIIQIEHNIVKNPYWLEANQLAIYLRVVSINHLISNARLWNNIFIISKNNNVLLSVSL